MLKRTREEKKKVAKMTHKQKRYQQKAMAGKNKDGWCFGLFGKADDIYFTSLHFTPRPPLDVCSYCSLSQLRLVDPTPRATKEDLLKQCSVLTARYDTFEAADNSFYSIEANDGV